jgi:hypothetical protein
LQASINAIKFKQIRNKISPHPVSLVINSILLILALLCFFSVPNTVTAQDEGPQPVNFQPNTWIQAGQIIPPSPQAASLGRYGNIPVNYYTGSPNIEIPLYTISGKYLNMPISLTYDANATQVGTLPSWTGLGWTLQTGGVITRTVIGNPDMDWNYYQWDWGPLANIFGGQNLLAGSNSDLIPATAKNLPAWNPYIPAGCAKPGRK